jgi:hypothetical protein
MLILFDDCAFSGKQPFVGTQAKPIPNIHNSAWKPSPGTEFSLDPSRWSGVEWETLMEVCKSYNKPMLCTEWLNRLTNNTLEGMLPLFHKEQMSWYFWGTCSR